MKHIIWERPAVDQVVFDKFLALKNVLSLSCVLSDAQERDNVMRHTMQWRSVNERIIGPALTVKLTAGDIVDCLAVFEVAKPGDLVVIDAFGETETSIWGGLMSGLAKAAGIVGVVIDGSARDIDEARMLNFPVYSTCVSPRASHTAYSGRKDPIEINTPIVCGGIIVHPGDLVVADEIGVVIAPAVKLEYTYEKVKAQADKEELTRRDVLNGATVDELLEKYRRI
ncbi:MAG: RraA family protein [Clostridiales Family XIII bacterium]|jgi:3-hexulose-6-phosphate synthase/6-phospho-3-hexuloisomerase|nr:RraA family protein [Clostridiales Family XIII bacterium]